MATFSKPTTTAQWDTSAINISTPDAGHIASGWSLSEKPPAPWFNYLHRTYGQWLGWLNERVFDGATSDEIVFRTPALPALNLLKLTASGGVTLTQNSSDPVLQISGTSSPGVLFYESDSAANAGKWRINTDTNGAFFSLSSVLDDNLTTVNSFITCDRSGTLFFVDSRMSLNTTGILTLANVASPRMNIAGATSGTLRLTHSGGALNSKYFDVKASGSVFTLESLSDVFVSSTFFQYIPASDQISAMVSKFITNSISCVTTAGEPASGNDATTRHRKNSIMAWARVDNTGAITASWGFASIVQDISGVGRYILTLNAGVSIASSKAAIMATPNELISINGFGVIITAKATSATTIRVELINETTSFYVANAFSVIVIGEPA